MWIADVGQDAWEEVNYMPAASTAGVNYGWRCREGKHNYNIAGCTGTYTDPVFEYPHNNATGGFSISGGYVYRGPNASNVSLLGTYLAADFVSGNFWLVQANGNATIQTGLPGSVVGFGEATDGTLYVLRRLGSPNGALYKIIVTGPLPVTITNFSGLAYTGFNQLNWSTSAEQNTNRFLIQYSTNNINFETVGSVNALGNANGNAYTFRHNLTTTGIAYYRLAIVDNDGSIKYSTTVRLVTGDNNAIKIYPTIVRDQKINLSLNTAVISMKIVTTDGRLVFEKDLRNLIGVQSVQLPQLSKGLYFIQIIGKDHSSKERMIIQ